MCYANARQIPLQLTDTGGAQTTGEQGSSVIRCTVKCISMPTVWAVSQSNTRCCPFCYHKKDRQTAQTGGKEHERMEQLSLMAATGKTRSMSATLSRRITPCMMVTALSGLRLPHARLRCVRSSTHCSRRSAKRAVSVISTPRPLSLSRPSDRAISTRTTRLSSACRPMSRQACMQSVRRHAYGP